MKTERYFYRALNILLIIVIAVSTAHVFTAYFIDRSLWIDEAMLMKSVVTRDFAGILAGMFDDNQSAPPGYMILVKAISYVFGNSTMSLRLASMILFFASIWFIYLIARDGMKFRIPLLPVAVIMSLWTVAYYATETKPYIGDVFFSLLSIWIYFRYKNGKTSFMTCALIMAVSIWFAFGALFTMGGLCAYHFVSCSHNLYLKKETAQEYWKQILPLIIVAVSVGLYYLLWALPASKNVPPANIDNYWDLIKFPLIPTSKADLITLIEMFRHLTDIEIQGTVSVCILFLGLALYIIFFRRTWFFYAMLWSFAMLLVVSWLGMYPMQLRLVLSQYVILWLMALCGIDRCISRIAKNKYTIALIAVVFIVPLGFAVRHAFDFSDKAFHLERHDVRECLEYVSEHRGPGSKVYISPSSRPEAQFYLNYPDTTSMYETVINETGDYIWGGMFRQAQSIYPYSYTITMQPERIDYNVRAIMKYDDVYIIDSHAPRVHIELIKALREAGCKVEQVADFHRTYVWHCTKQ